MIETYTKWLRECPGAEDCLINVAPDNAGFTPYRWKIASMDGTVLGHVKFSGPTTNGTENERRAELCRLLQLAIARHSPLPCG
jgi:hypothetical protein